MLLDNRMPSVTDTTTLTKQTGFGIRQYRLSVQPLASAEENTIAEWREFRKCYASNVPLQDPEWLRGYFEGQTENLIIYSLYESNRLCGFAPFLRRDWPLKWHLGELPVATFPFTRLRLLGGEVGFPDDPVAYDLLFNQLAKDDSYNALYLDDIPIDSFFWKYLHTAEIPQHTFIPYQPDAPSPRPILRIDGTFEEYMGKFSGKHRKNLTRAIRKIRDGELGPMRFIRYERPEQVEDFLGPGVEVSRQTYQWKLHQRGLYATDLMRRRLQFASNHGWMRCYVLFCGDRPCAYAVGLQYADRFLLEDIGFEPSLAKHSVGTVLQLLMVEDLFNFNRPQIFDLGEYGGYKETLSTESYLQGRTFLFRRGIYGWLVRSGHRACIFVTHTVASTLDRYHLKSRVKRFIRGWAAETVRQ